MWYPHCFKIALQSIRTVRHHIQPLNQATGAHDISRASHKQFGEQRSNLRDLSPRSRGINIHRGEYGNCGELAMALQAILIHNFSFCQNSIQSYRTNAATRDHAFCVLEIGSEIHQMPSIQKIYFEVDAWHPRIELIHPLNIASKPHFTSLIYGPCEILEDPYYDIIGFRYDGGQTRPIKEVSFGPFQTMHDDEPPRGFYKNYPLEEKSLRKNFSSGLEVLYHYSWNTYCQNIWDSIWSQSQKITPFYNE